MAYKFRKGDRVVYLKTTSPAYIIVSNKVKTGIPYSIMGNVYIIRKEKSEDNNDNIEVKEDDIELFQPSV